jgi:hypothetical protein
MGCVYLLYVSATTSIYFHFIYFQEVMTHVSCIYFVGLDGDAASNG